MKSITKQQINHFKRLTTKLEITQDAESIINMFSLNNSLEEMEYNEAYKMVDYLLKHHERAEAMNSMRRKMIYYASQIGYGVAKKPIEKMISKTELVIQNLDRFLLSSKSLNKKKLNELSYSELVSSLSQFQKIYISYIRTNKQGKRI